MAETLYQGIGFPFTVESSDLPEKVTDDRLIRDSLLQIVLTTKGERVMRPDFGCSAYDFVFESNDQLLVAMIRRTVGNAIAQWESRVIVQNIDVQKVKNDNVAYDTVVITVYYIVKTTQQQNELSVSIGPGQSAVEG